MKKKKKILDKSLLKPGALLNLLEDLEGEKAKLRESEEKLRTINENITDAIFAKDKDRKYTFVNSAAVGMMGTSIDKIIGRTAEEIFSKGDAQTIKGVDDMNFSGQKVSEINQLKIGGRVVFLHTAQSPIYDKNKKVIGITGVVKDVTEKRKAEKDLAESEEKYRVLVEESRDFIFMVDSNHNVLSVNGAAKALFGGEDIIGKNISELFPKETSKGYIVNLDKIFSNGKSQTFESEMPVKGRSYFISTILNPIKDARGKVTSVFGVVRDITEMKKAETEVREAKERAENYLKITGSIIVALDNNGVITLLNKKGYEIVEYPEDSLIGKNWIELFIPKKQLREISEVHKINVEKPHKFLENFENEIVTKSGKHLIISWHNALIKDDAGEIIGTLSSGEDVTDKRKAEKELILQKERAESYLDLAGNIIIALNRKGEITLLNKKGCEILECELDDVRYIGKNWFDCCLPKHNLKEVKEVFNKLMRGETKLVEHYENAILSSSGKERIISWYNNLIKNAKGEVTGVLSSGEDITERKKDEKEIKRLNEELKQRAEVSEEKYRILYECSADAIMTIQSPTWKFTSGNPSALRMFGAKDEREFISLGPWDVSPKLQPDGKASADKAKEMIAKAMKEGSNFFEWTHKRIGGEEFPATVLLTRVEIEKGKPFLQATVRDITSQKKAELDLKKSYEELKTLDELKSNFLIITSHELKTPITPLMIQAQMLVRGDLGPLTEKQKQGAQIIYKNMERLTRLINDILDVSKISSKVLKLQLTKKNINDCISEVISEKNPQAEEKGVKINFIKGKVPEIMADDFRFHQIMINLLDNAVKFTPAGGKISVKTTGRKDSVLVSVADTGRGIKKASMENLFKPFFQSKPSYLDRYRGGTGLGLAIVRGIVRQHGGKIWVKSTFGKGTTFYFTLPINPPKNAENLNNLNTTENKEKKGKMQVKRKIPVKKDIK
jgi:PAS domain S-box-containing protein